jgi:hypothetical protein
MRKNTTHRKASASERSSSLREHEKRLTTPGCTLTSLCLQAVWEGDNVLEGPISRTDVRSSQYRYPAASACSSVRKKTRWRAARRGSRDGHRCVCGCDPPVCLAQRWCKVCHQGRLVSKSGSCVSFPVAPDGWVTCRIHWRHHKPLAAQREPEAAYSVHCAPFLAFRLGRACFCQHVHSSAWRYVLPAGSKYSPQKQSAVCPGVSI